MRCVKSLVVFVLAIGCLIASGPASGSKPPLERAVDALPQPPDAKRNSDPKMAYFLVVAKECDDCARLCNLSAAHATRMMAEGKKEYLEVARACADCANICSATAAVTARYGPDTDLICLACAEACKRCAEICQKHAADPIMKQCADECRKCEEACRKMLKLIVKPMGDPKPGK